MQVSVARLDDERGVRAALAGCNSVYHLASAEWEGRRGDLLDVDVKGTRVVTEAAMDAGVKRFMFVSHLAADRASAYPVLKAKGIAEEIIRRSGLNFTVLRTALLYGREDSFVNSMALIVRLFPFAFPIPGEGRSLIQPLWVEDLVTCLQWGLDDPAAHRQTYSVGGPEFFTLEQLAQTMTMVMGRSRRLLHVPAAYLRLVANLVELVFPHPPLTTRVLDHLSVNCTAELVSVTRYFGLKPARFETAIEYLKVQGVMSELGRFLSAAG